MSDEYIGIVRYFGPAINFVLLCFQRKCPIAKLWTVWRTINFEATIERNRFIIKHSNICHDLTVLDGIFLVWGMESFPKLIVLLDIKANIMITCNSYFRFMWKFAKPIVDYLKFSGLSNVSQVSTVNQNISIWYSGGHSVFLVVCIRKDYKSDVPFLWFSLCTLCFFDHIYKI